MKNRHTPPPATAPREETLKAVVDEAVTRYARRCWWVDRADLTQEAWLVACSAARTFKPAVWAGDTTSNGLYWYVWRAVVIQLRNYLWRESAPVVAPQRKLAELAGVHRAPLSARPDGPAEVEPADAVLSEARRRAAISAAVLGAVEPEHYPLARVALAGDEAAARRLRKHVERTSSLRRLHSEHS